jgi:hypothetical protein
MMDATREPFYRRDESETMADVRDAMSRCGDFDPAPERYTNEMNFFEVLAVLEALMVEGEVLA